MLVAGRRREQAEIGHLLDHATRGAGGMLVITGPAGSGKTLLAEYAAAEARGHGFQVLWARPAHGQPGRMAWAQLLRDTQAPADLVTGLLDAGAGPLDLDSAARHLVDAAPRLIVVDDIDVGGPDAAAMLAVVAARCASAPVAVLATSTGTLGLRPELRLDGLSEAELLAAVGGIGRLGWPDGQAGHALWLASRGLPGVARRLAQGLAQGPRGSAAAGRVPDSAASDWDPGGAGASSPGPDLAGNSNPVVRLALTTESEQPFLGIDTNLVRLLEAASTLARDDVTRARVLARLAHELLGDATAAARRRSYITEALALARRAGDAGALADVLDAQLHALWDQDGAQDRLAAGSEIVELARAAGDAARERHGMFWRFVALMELGRVHEAETALANFAREAEVAGDAQAAAIVTARHSMLATLHGRFDEARRLANQTAIEAHRAGLPDAWALSSTLRGHIDLEQGFSADEWGQIPDVILALARERPGHLFEAAAARLQVALGRMDEAAAELDRLLPRALASSGPRWLGSMTHLAIVAAATGDADAAGRIYQALLPYRGQLVVLAGANTAWGTVSHHLGVLAAVTGRPADAIAHFEEAIEFAERIGALPYVAHSLAGLAGALASTGDHARAAGCAGRAREIAQRLGMSVLLERLGPSASEWSLVREDGADWLLTAGAERARLRDGRGLHYLRALLAEPARDIRALDLAAGGSGLAATGTGPVIDGAARAAYRRRLTEVTAAAAAADRAGDVTAAERAEAERVALERELRSAASLGGRVRDASPEAERARVNVTRTLRAAIDRIAAVAPVAAAHLRASIKTGTTCRYDPATGGPDHWLV